MKNYKPMKKKLVDYSSSDSDYNISKRQTKKKKIKPNTDENISIYLASKYRQNQSSVDIQSQQYIRSKIHSVLKQSSVDPILTPPDKNITSNMNNPLKEYRLEEISPILDTNKLGTQSVFAGNPSQQHFKLNINNPSKKSSLEEIEIPSILEIFYPKKQCTLAGVQSPKIMKPNLNYFLKDWIFDEILSISATKNSGNQYNSAEIQSQQQIKPNVNCDLLRQSTLEEIRSILAQIMPLLENYEKNQKSKEKIQLFLNDLPFLKSLQDLTMYQGTYELFHKIFLRVLIENLICLIDQESSIESGEILNSLMFFKENLDNFEKKPIDVGVIPMALHYTLHFLNYPKETNTVYIKKIWEGEIHVESGNSQLKTELLNSIRKKVEEKIVVGYQIIDNFYSKKNEISMEQKIKHVKALLCEIFENKKINFINYFSEIDDVGETVFDGNVYLPLQLFETFKLGNPEEKNKAVENLTHTLLNELAHLKRIRYSSLNFFFKPTPQKFENGESGDWLEKNYDSAFIITEKNITGISMQNKTKIKVKCGTTHPPAMYRKRVYEEDSN